MCDYSAEHLLRATPASELGKRHDCGTPWAPSLVTRLLSHSSQLGLHPQISGLHAAPLEGAQAFLLHQKFPCIGLDQHDEAR